MTRLLTVPTISGAIVGGALGVAEALQPEDTTSCSVYGDTALGHICRSAETGTWVAFNGGHKRRVGRVRSRAVAVVGAT
jgi:hypothetical protein